MWVLPCFAVTRFTLTSSLYFLTDLLNVGEALTAACPRATLVQTYKQSNIVRGSFRAVRDKPSVRRGRIETTHGDDDDDD